MKTKDIDNIIQSNIDKSLPITIIEVTKNDFKILIKEINEKLNKVNASFKPLDFSSSKSTFTFPNGHKLKFSII